MDKSKLRVCTDLNELHAALQKHLNKDLDFLVWQDQDNVKMALPAVLSKMTFVQDQLTIEFKMSNHAKLEPKTETYMMCSELNLLLRGVIKIKTRTEIRVTIKDKHYANENRANPRYSLEDKKCLANIFRRMDLQDKEKEEQVKLKDISGGGCGFYITSSRATSFQPDSKLVLKSLGKMKLDIPIEGTIKHVTPVDSEVEIGFNSLNTKVLLVGVQFDEAFTDIQTVLQEA